MMNISMYEIIQMCQFFDVEFKITSEKEVIYYHFDELKWCKSMHDNETMLTLNDFILINRLLGAKYPDKVKLHYKVD